MNPKKIKLDLLFRGNFLKGEQMNLKSLKFSKGVPNRLTIVDKP